MSLQSFFGDFIHDPIEFVKGTVTKPLQAPKKIVTELTVDGLFGGLFTGLFKKRNPTGQGGATDAGTPDTSAPANNTIKIAVAVGVILVIIIVIAIAMKKRS